MTNYVKAGETISYRVGMGKKSCRRALKKNFWFLLLCWTVTLIVLAASFGTYVFLSFVGVLWGFSTDLIAVGVSVLTSLPLIVGNIEVSRHILKGRKADIYLLFNNYFNFLKFWKWVYLYVICLSPGWLLSLVFAAFSNDLGRFLPFFGKDVLFYLETAFEVVTVFLVFASLCKSLYFLFQFNLNVPPKLFFEKEAERYEKKKSFFKKYVLSHFYIVIIFFMVKKSPVYLGVGIITITLGYFVLSLSAFSEGFGIKFKKHKLKRIEKRI